MADFQDLEDDVDLPEEAVASPVKRPLSRLRRKGEHLPDSGGIVNELPPDKIPFQDDGRVYADICEGPEPNSETYSNRTKSYDEEEAGISPHQDEKFSRMEPEASEERHVAGYSDNDDGNLPEESDEEAELARRLREGESESEGEGGGSDSDSDAGEAHRKRAREEGTEGPRDGDGSEAEAEELNFDKDRDDDEYEGPSQPDVLLKKHKRRRDGEEDIHAESQRLLRETRGVSFKPQATVQKPLSSLLEKIRKRKEELFGASNPPPERPPPFRKPLSADVLKQATAGRQRVGDANGDVSEGGPDDSDDDMVLEIVDTKEPSKVASASPKKEGSEKEETPHTDADPHTGYDGDLEDDDDEALTFDFRKRGAERPEEPFRPPVADTQDLFTEPEGQGVDGFVEEDKEEEMEAPAEKAARPVFPMFQRKPVAKVPKFSEPFRMPVEDTQDLFSEPQFDDENVEPPAESAGEPFGDPPEEAQGEGSDVEDDVMPSRMKLTMDNSKSQPIEDPWDMEGSEDGSKEDEENERGEKDDILEREMSPPRPLPSPRKSPKKKTAVSDAVRRFVDDEAEEEDSDGNLGNLSDDDEDPAAAADDMEYVIDTRAEAVIDNGEKERLALHRQWAEQQDMKDTKELLDRMKNGWQRPGAAAALMDSDDEDDMDLPPDILRRRRLAARAAARARDEAFDEYDADAAASDEEEGSDGPGSEDEEFREQVLRRRRLQESESLDPEPVDFEDDEASREVLGLLKRPTVPIAGPVNAEPHKGKGRGSLLGLFSKKNKALKSSSSFLNRASVSSRDGTGNVKTANAGSGTGRYYIFGRDDSNSGMGFDRKERPDAEAEMAPEPSKPSSSQAPTNFAGIASRVGAAGPKRSVPLGAMAPSKFFGLLSKSSRPDMDIDELPAEVPSFLREFKTVKKSAFVR